MFICAGCDPTAHGRLHIPVGARENETSVAELSAKTTGEQARRRAIELGQCAQETQNRGLYR